MSYNPKIHSDEKKNNKLRLAIDPRAGIKHSSIAAKHGVIGVCTTDLNKRVTTASGWRIPYVSGKQFEVYYELLCARNSMGMVNHPTKDRCIRVLAGQLFVTSKSEIQTVLANQVCFLESGVSYELSSSGDSDVELLVIQEFDYEEDLEHITEPSVGNSKAILSVFEREVIPRSKSDAAIKEAERINTIRAERAAGPNRPPKRPPLPGQTMQGVNPRPIGAGGFGEE
jgi:mannose-6-phosphate isomerase-like protein (cupin superfamily)